jgi:hypothetical protein
LNLGYFDADQLQCAIGNLHCYLQEEGCLVVSRNHDDAEGETENGSVWVKRGKRFSWVEDFGRGSEIKPIVDGWRPG